MPIGRYILTPSLTGYIFIPSARAIYLDGINATSFNFVATLNGRLATAAHTFLVRSDGTIWGWGSNGNGQLGNGTTTNSSTPVQVTALSGGMAAAAGRGDSVVMKSDNTVWTWGNNRNGQLGDGTTTDRWTPVQAP